ncbi:MAG: flippase-like domain-containing protein [Planctomycetes bacterium]|nr:flippase-like domain-containing protein [Planctomycetota bacterium]
MRQILKSKRALVILSLLISAVFVGSFVWKQEWGKIGHAFREASLFYMTLSLVPMGLAYLFRTFRWQILMRPVKRLSFLQTLGPVLIAFTANNVLPARIGEIVRPAIIKVRYKKSFTATLATVAVERLMDLISLGILLGYVCLFWPIPPAAAPAGGTADAGVFNVVKAAVFLVVMIGGALTFVLVLRLWPDRVKRLVAWQPTLLNLVDSFIVGLSFIDHLRHVLLTLLYSLLLWTMAALSMYYSALAFHLSVTYSGACLTLLSVALAVAIPQGPAFVGSFHWACQLSMQMLGNPEVPSASFGIQAHAVAVLPVTICGFIALWAMGLSLRQIRRQAETEAGQETDSTKSETG